MMKSRIVLFVLSFFLIIITSSCRDGRELTIEFTNPVIMKDSSGTWIVNNNTGNKFYFFTDSVWLAKHAESHPYQTNGDKLFYRIKPKSENNRYDVYFDDSSQLPYYHPGVDFENYSARIIVMLSSGLTFREMLEGPCPLKSIINKIFCQRVIDELPDTVFRNPPRLLNQHFIRQFSTGKIILIPDCYWDSDDDIHFNPLPLIDALGRYEETEVKIHGYKVYTNADFKVDDYILRLTRSKVNPSEYDEVLCSRHLIRN